MLFVYKVPMNEKYSAVKFNWKYEKKTQTNYSFKTKNFKPKIICTCFSSRIILQVFITVRGIT